MAHGSAEDLPNVVAIVEVEAAIAVTGPASAGKVATVTHAGSRGASGASEQDAANVTTITALSLSHRLTAYRLYRFFG